MCLHKHKQWSTARGAGSRLEAAARAISAPTTTRSAGLRGAAGIFSAGSPPKKKSGFFLYEPHLVLPVAQKRLQGGRLRARGCEGETGLVEGIFPLLYGPCDAGKRGELRPLRQARCGVQALLALQARLLLRGCMPERELEAPQEDVCAAGASTGRRCEDQRGKCSTGLAGDSEVGGAHGRADGSSFK